MRGEVILDQGGPCIQNVLETDRKGDRHRGETWGDDHVKMGTATCQGC